jgi:carnitine O-acetyltransferase
VYTDRLGFPRYAQTLIVFQVVEDGFGVAYMTGFDGKHRLEQTCWAEGTNIFIDYLQYTITSRKDMPIESFCKNILKAADDLYNLHADAASSKAKL